MRFLMLIALFCGMSMNAQKLPQAEERSIQIFTIGSWVGDFAVDANGRGGLAALHSLRKSIGDRLAPLSGQALLFQAGRFTSAKTASEFVSALKLPTPGLLQYIGFDAMAFASDEIESSTSKEPIKENSKSVRTQSLVERRMNFERSSIKFASVTVRISPGAYPKDLANASDLLEKELDGPQPDVIVLFFPDGGAEAFLKFRTIANVHSPVPPDIERFIFEPGKDDTFYRDPSGPFYCRTSGRHICSVTLKFRNHTRIALEQKFIDLNGENEPAAFLKPDPVLMDTFRR